MSRDGPPYMPPTPWTVWGVVDDCVQRAQKVTSSPDSAHGVRPSPDAAHDDASTPTSIRILEVMHRRYSSVWFGRPHTSTD